MKQLLFIFIILFNTSNIDACFATQPATTPTVSTTEAPVTDPPELRMCSADSIMYGQANGAGAVDVTHFGYAYTVIPGTLETTSTVKISCKAIDGYYVNMEFANGQQVKENLDSLQNITVEATCNSATMEWIYSTTLPDGTLYTASVTEVTCLQLPDPDQPVLRMCSTDAITFNPGDGETPQGQIDVSHFGYTYTTIPGTVETTSTVKISCQAIDGYFVFMEFANGQQVKENLDSLQNITVEATCNSETMEWIYSTTLPDGTPYTASVTEVTCLQLPDPDQPVLRMCSTDAITFNPGDGETPQGQIDVSHFGYTYTVIPGTVETTSSVKISCQAIDGYYVNMDFTDGQAKENSDSVQNITIEATCNSETMNWVYSTTLADGSPYSTPVTEVTCLQVPEVVDPEQRRCAAASLSLVPADTVTPQIKIEVTTSGLTYTPIAGTTDTTATMSISCSAVNGLNAFMYFPANRAPQENGGPVFFQTVTITASCSSVDMVWRYTTVLQDGSPHSEPITMVGCNQVS